LLRRVALGIAVLSLLTGGCRSPRSERCVTLVCVGDVMLGRGIADICARQGNYYPFEHVAALLQAGDVTFGNLEAVITDRETRFPRINALRAEPQMAAVLKQVGFDVMGLANNHAIDYQRAGLRQCMELLQAKGITPVGAGSTLAEARQGAVVTVRGLRIGFIAYSHFPYTTFVHDPKRESILLLDEETLRETLPALARRCDVLVVSFHWGKEGSREVSEPERHLAHLAVELGTDLVVGHHAHVCGDINTYRGALIAYCLGNLVFDEQSYGGNEGYVLTCELTRNGVADHWLTRVEVVEGQPRIRSRNGTAAETGQGMAGS